MNTKLMQGTTGVYQTVYAETLVTVRIFEAVELNTWLAAITYKDLLQGGTKGTELDQLTSDQVQHCKNRAAELDPSFGDDYKAYMAQAYWSLIQ